MAKEEIKSGLTWKIWIILIPWIVIVMAFETVQMVALAWREAWFPPTLIILLAIEYGLILISPKLRWFTKEEWVALFTIGSMTTMVTYLAGRTLNFTLIGMPAGTQIAPILHQRSAAFSPLKPLVPNFLAPTSAAALDGFWFGTPSTVDWNAWMPSIMFWAAFNAVLFSSHHFWGFLLRRSLVEIEKLPFPGILPTAYTLQYYTEITETSQLKPKLFSLKETFTKFFWIGFTIGVFFSVPIFTRGLIPGFTGVPYYFDINLYPYYQSFLPGAYINGQISLSDVPLFYLAPLDVLLTIQIGWLVFAIIYPVVGVKLGFLPYSIGYETSVWNYGVSYGPFKWMRWLWLGVPLGVGIWILVMNFGHIRHVFSVALRRRSEGPKEESGVSYRLVGLGCIATFIAFIVILVVAGVHPIPAFLFMVLQIVAMWGWTRSAAEYGGIPGLSYYGSYGIYWDMGAGTAWSWSRPDTRFYMAGTLFGTAGNDYHRMTGLSMHNQVQLYKMGDMVKTRAKDILVLSVVSAVVISVLVSPWYVWMMHKYGGYAGPGNLQRNVIAYSTWFSGYIPPHTATGTASAFIPETWTLFLTGIFATIGLYILRLRFPWFIINPIGLIAVQNAYWVTFNSLTALILKVLTLRIGGAKLYREVGVPVAVGFAMGFVATYFFYHIYVFIVRGLPIFL